LSRKFGQKSVKERPMRRAQQITLTATERFALEMWIARPQTSARHRLRFEIALAAAGGGSNQTIAAELNTTAETVARWRGRFAARRMAGIQSDADRSGRPPAIADELVTQLLRQMLFPNAPWSFRSMAKAVGISKSSVQRAWTHLNEVLAEEWHERYLRRRELAKIRPAPFPPYSPAQLARAQEAHRIVFEFVQMSFDDFDRYYLGGDRALTDWERIAATFQQFENDHGRMLGQEAEMVGRSILGISLRQPNEPALISQDRWDELEKIYAANPPLVVPTVDDPGGA
jgi:hypothetical protein